MELLRKYDLERYIKPLWDTDTVELESVLFIEGEDSAPLLFPADEILGVFSADLTAEYREGVDWALRDGCLVRLPSSAMPVISLAEYYPAEHRDGMDFGCTVEGRPFIRFGEGDTFLGRQIAVTYRKSAAWTGPVPETAKTLTRFREKLTKGAPVRVVFYGDSITVGANASGFVGVPPHAPIWANMVTDGMKLRSGNENVTNVNTAVGGMESNWGLANIGDRVIAHRPDLLVLAFGMNDGAKSPEEFLALIHSMVEKVQTECPSCDIALVSTMLPHDKVAGFYLRQWEYEAHLEAFVREKEHMALIPMTRMHRYLLTRKPYPHMTGNNVNHPNDFLSRVYAMTALRTILG